MDFLYPARKLFVTSVAAAVLMVAAILVLVVTVHPGDGTAQSAPVVAKQYPVHDRSGVLEEIELAAQEDTVPLPDPSSEKDKVNQHGKIMDAPALPASDSSEDPQYAYADGRYDNSDLARAAASVSYSRPSWYRDGYEGTALWKAVFWTVYPKNRFIRSCTANLSAIVRWCGADRSYPFAAGKRYEGYVRNSSKWQVVGQWNGDEATLQPGDILMLEGPNHEIAPDPSFSHACMYIGHEVAMEVYERTLKGTDADRGAPTADAAWVSGHYGGGLTSATSAAPCIGSYRYAYSKGVYSKKYWVIRYVGDGAHEVNLPVPEGTTYGDLAGGRDVIHVPELPSEDELATKE